MLRSPLRRRQDLRPQPQISKPDRPAPEPPRHKSYLHWAKSPARFEELLEAQRWKPAFTAALSSGWRQVCLMHAVTACPKPPAGQKACMQAELVRKMVACGEHALAAQFCRDFCLSLADYGVEPVRAAVQMQAEAQACLQPSLPADKLVRSALLGQLSELSCVEELCGAGLC